MHAVVALLLALSAPVQTQYDTVFDQIKNLAPQSNAAASVHGLVLHRDVMELHLDDGVAYRLTPVAGRTTAIAFVGTGSISFIINQTDVPASFAMYVPLRIKFAEGEAIVRVLVRGPLTEQTITLPAEAKSIELSPFESVLAQVKTEAW
jgi:hypothetical protein